MMQDRYGAGQQDQADEARPQAFSRCTPYGYTRSAYEKRDAGNEHDEAFQMQGLGRVGHHFLDGYCERDDAGHHRKMQETVNVSRKITHGARVRLEGLFECIFQPPEVGPPQYAHQDHGTYGYFEQVRGHFLCNRPIAGGDERFPECDNDDQSVALGKMGDVEAP